LYFKILKINMLIKEHNKKKIHYLIHSPKLIIINNYYNLIDKTPTLILIFKIVIYKYLNI